MKQSFEKKITRVFAVKYIDMFVKALDYYYFNQLVAISIT